MKAKVGFIILFIGIGFYFFSNEPLQKLEQSSREFIPVDKLFEILRDQKSYEAAGLPYIDEIVREQLKNMSPEDAGRYASEFIRNVDLFDSGKGMIGEPGLLEFWNKNKNKRIQGELLHQFAERKMGVVIDENKDIVGVATLQYKGKPVTVVQCSICHVGKVYGKIVPGLGNKRFDPYYYGKFIEFFRSMSNFSKESVNVDPEIKKTAEYYRRRMIDSKVTNLSQGMIPVGIVRASFYPDPMNLPKGISRSQSKVPQLWGYGWKRQVGAFHDGFGDTDGGWAAGVAIVGQQTAEIVNQPYYREKTHVIETIFEFLQPIAYPLPLSDQDQISWGKSIYTETCKRCHGEYIPGVGPTAPPKWISINSVKTDPDLFYGTTHEFKKYILEGPFKGFLNFSKEYDIDKPRYLAPHLTGIWARFPYLHNGSVPTLMDLLESPKNRPTIFSLDKSTEIEGFDPDKVGIKNVPRTEAARLAMVKRKRITKDRGIYSVFDEGQKNIGHDYSGFLSVIERKALVEYLKTL